MKTAHLNIKKVLIALSLVLVTGTVLFGGSRVYAAAGDTGSCQPTRQVFGLPTWYKYLGGQRQADPNTLKEVCQPTLDGLMGIWKIVAAVIEMLLRIAMLVAIAMVVYGGVLYMISQGSPDKTKQALKTIINALVGLAIAIVATALVSFVAGRFTEEDPAPTSNLINSPPQRIKTS